MKMKKNIAIALFLTLAATGLFAEVVFDDDVVVEEDFYADGLVGIGTRTPTANLDISSASGNTLLKATSLSGYAGLFLNSAGTSSGGRLVFMNDSVSSANISYEHGETYSDRIMRINVSGAGVEFAVLGSGMVGVGTETPAARLEVAGADNELLRLNASTTNAEIKFATAGTPYWTVGSANQGPDFRIRDENNSVDTVTIKAQGNVGIGTSTPTEKLEVEGNLKVNGSIILTAQGDIPMFQ